MMNTICLKAISRDLFESVLPKPELLVDKDLLPSLCVEQLSSCFGGASFLMFTTLSTIFVPISTGLSASLSFPRDLLLARMAFPLL